MDAFLLSSSLCNTISNFMHKSTCCCWYRSLNEMRRNEGAVPFILCRALHAGRTALIGRIWSPLHPMTTVRGRVDVRVECVVVVVSSFVPIFPLGGSTVVQVGRWRHC